jgi:hypothetical protein
MKMDKKQMGMRSVSEDILFRSLRLDLLFLSTTAFAPVTVLNDI